VQTYMHTLVDRLETVFGLLGLIIIIIIILLTMFMVTVIMT